MTRRPGSLESCWEKMLPMAEGLPSRSHRKITPCCNVDRMGLVHSKIGSFMRSSFFLGADSTAIEYSDASLT
jgi:hypothetical protein